MLKNLSLKFISQMLLFLAILISINICYGITQSKSVQEKSVKPVVGEPCPYFELSHVTHYSKEKVTSNELRGKWLFLDFWFPGCSSCIKSFPKISELQSEFDDIQFLLVGLNGGQNKNSKNIFEKLAVRQNLKIAVAYDSVLNKRWGIHAMPHIVIIDPEGIVRYRTDGRDMTKEKLEKLLKGEKVSFFNPDLIRPKFDPTSTIEERNIYSSILTQWNGEQQSIGYDIEQYASIVNYPTEKYRPLIYSGLNLKMLYFIAFFGDDRFRFMHDTRYGQIYPIPLLEIQDKSAFDYSYDENIGEGLFNYALRLPRNQITKENLMKYMQEDFERTFGYRALVEEREMPVWKLIVQKENKFTSKGGAPYNSAKLGSHAVGFKVKNVPISELIIYLFSYLSEKQSMPFLDYTGISENIDFSIETDLTNFHDVQIALQKIGLDIVAGEERMKVLIIQDKGQ